MVFFLTDQHEFLQFNTFYPQYKVITPNFADRYPKNLLEISLCLVGTELN